jgi:hypothetical protein
MNGIMTRVQRLAWIGALMALAGAVVQGCGPLPEEDGGEPPPAVMTDPEPTASGPMGTGVRAGGMREGPQNLLPPVPEPTDEPEDPKPSPPDGGAYQPPGRLQAPSPTR